MSEARALTDKLKEVQEELRQTREQLDKQRTQHTREQQALSKAIEETRREAARLRERVEKAEARRREQERALSPLATLALEEGGAEVIVALARPPPSVDEALPVLSRLLRLSPVDTRLRLTQSQPSILARLPTPEAERLRDQLTAEGFSVVLGGFSRLAEGGVVVRRFTLEEQALSVENARGERHDLLYRELRLLARGRKKSTTIERDVERVYDRTLERHVVNESKIEHEHLHNFLWVYGGDTRAIITEDTSFAGLGSLRGASKAATLQILMGELRKRAPQVLVDDRFLRGIRVALPLVGQERSQEVLAGLTDEAIKEGMWPGAPVGAARGGRLE
jgi:hypothetical protein